MGKKILVLFLIIAVIGSAAFLFISGNKQKMSDNNGNKLNYSIKEIQDQALTGAFVKNPDNTLSPSPTEMPGFDGAIEEFDKTRYVWYSNANQNISGLIPVANKDSKLVIVYNNNSEIPEDFYLEKYAFRGYTFGVHFFTDLDKTMYIDKENMLADSQASSIFSGEELSEDTYIIDSISGLDTLPINNVNNDIGAMLGLDKNKLYDLKFYIGTYAKEITLESDTLIFQASQYIKLTAPLQKTSEGYFIINLPSNLAPGYYYLSDIGFFKYEG